MVKIEHKLEKYEVVQGRLRRYVCTELISNLKIE